MAEALGGRGMSGTVYLIDELMPALAAPSPAQMQELADLGVPPVTTILCGTAGIRLEADGLYVPEDDGLEAVVVPIFDGDQTVDLLAFNLAKPARWWTRTGAHWALGGNALDDLWLNETLLVFRSPLSWLQASAPSNGLTVLDWGAARRNLLHVEIIAEDLAHGEELHKKLTIPATRPQIRVPKEKAA